MPNDPGLAGDTCFYMEAVSGDGGTHDPAGTWWLSPDIQLTGPVSGPDNADPGQVYDREHRFSNDRPGCDRDTTDRLECAVGIASGQSARSGSQMSHRQMFSRQFVAEQLQLFSAGRSARGATQHLHRSVP